MHKIPNNEPLKHLCFIITQSDNIIARWYNIYTISEHCVTGIVQAWKPETLHSEFCPSCQGFPLYPQALSGLFFLLLKLNITNKTANRPLEPDLKCWQATHEGAALLQTAI